ncbi:MAG: ABC transporter permease [Planctomycetota bacterium]|jgi:ABC-type transport system involved in multi-copper enzyme maturation permease subunit
MKNTSETAVSEESAGRIRSVNGSPTVWKELRAPLLRGHKVAAFIVVSISLLVLFATYAFFAHEHGLDEEELHMLYVTIFMGLGMLFTIVLPATCITSEKESRSWPLLLVTTLSDEQILFGKFIGVLRRCLPIWLFLFGHVILFVIVGYIHLIAVLQLAVLVAWVVVFLSCTGLYFSSRFRRSTTAVIMNFAFAAAIWALVPLLLVLVLEAIGGSEDLIECYMDTNPFVHAIVVMDGTAGRGSVHDYHWVSFHNLNVFESTCWMFFCMLGYICVGFLFAWRAKCRIRRNVF